MPNLLHAQHCELDHLLAEVEYLAERRAFGAAKKRFDQFRASLLAHLQMEEEELLPAYIEAHGDPQGLVRQVHAQHAQLETVLEAVASSLAQGDYSEFCYGLSAMSKLMSVHQRTEEGLWPEAAAASP
jgi:hypothetical protein